MASAKQIDANRLNARLASGPKTQEGRRRSAVNARKHGLTQPVQVSEFGRHLPALEALILRDGCDPSQARVLALCILDYERNVQNLKAQFEWSEPQGLQLHESEQAGEADVASARKVAGIVSASVDFSRRDRSALSGLAALHILFAKHQIQKEERAQRSTERHYRRAANQLLKCLRTLVP